MPPTRPPKAATTSGDTAGPVRTCVGCRQRHDQADLVRITRSDEGSLLVGRTLPGRGAWLCRASASCLDLAVRRNGFARSLRAPVSATALAELRSALDAGQGS
ncbi:MAG: YlxR family protein [Acidimicrobiales bacterium]|nr:YlxR family protein [Acidimicrobiales bacterium]